MDELKQRFLQWGLDENAVIVASSVVAFAGMLALAYLAHLITKRILLRTVEHFIQKSRTTWDDALRERKVFRRLSHLAPALVIYWMAPVVFAEADSAINAIRLAAQIYMLLVGLLVVDSFLSATLDICRPYEFSRRLPIRGFVQIVKVALYFFAGILILSKLMGESPGYFLTGLGAMTAVLLLIFKDTILGFVAGIQLSTNQMVRIGDWIEMPKYGADGDVIDISISAVKVQNWDKTITTIPPYALISDSFKNWSGMSESGGRRIKRAVYIDMTSVKFCTEEMLRTFRKIQHITEYIDTKKREISEHNLAHEVDDSVLVNGRRMTNIGTFRAYVIAYLQNHPKIHQRMTFLVRQLEITSHGLPIEIYVFSSDTVWANYEAIQADIFDHILAVIPEFELRVFQEPTGADVQSLARAG